MSIDVREHAPSGVRAANTSAARVGLVSWTAIVLTGAAVALVLRSNGAEISINAPPLHARVAPALSVAILLPMGVATIAVAYGPRVAHRLQWRSLLVVSAGAAAVWALSLAVVRGSHRIVAPLLAPQEYFAAVGNVHDIGAFLGGFVQHIATYPVHVQGHPPGTVLLLAALRAVGLGSPWWAATVFVAAGAAAVPAVLVAVREVAGVAVARDAAPFVILAPAAIWVATSADALYTGVGAWGVALVVVATGRRDRRGDVTAAVGGLALAAAAFGSYGLVLLATIPMVVAVHRRRLRPIAVALGAAIAVILAFGVAGFWWTAGLAATRARYLAGIASRRPYAPFLFINLAAFSLALGPATGAGLARLRDRGLSLIVGGAVAAIAIAEISGMSKGEVERIWLPFAPWVLVAGTALAAPAVRSSRGRPAVNATVAWLSAQAATAIALESIVRTPW
jgi:methylthioxylose transferase